jgi:hypothetical protein
MARIRRRVLVRRVEAMAFRSFSLDDRNYLFHRG